MNRETRAGGSRASGRSLRILPYPAVFVAASIQIDHIIAQQHASTTVLENLSLACPHCNRYRGPNIAGLDPDSGQLVRLFHPRTDRWPEHLEFVGAQILGKTSIGRATVQTLALHAREPMLFRLELLRSGFTFS